MARGKNAPKLPGVDEQPSIPELTEAAVMYRKQAVKLSKLRGVVGDLKASVLAKMAEHNLTTYTDEEVSPALKVTIVKGKDKLQFVDEDAGDDAGADVELTE